MEEQEMRKKSFVRNMCGQMTDQISTVDTDCRGTVISDTSHVPTGNLFTTLCD